MISFEEFASQEIFGFKNTCILIFCFNAASLSLGEGVAPRQASSLFFQILQLKNKLQNRIQTGSDLSLGERLTRLSKRLSRKRCCDTTPDRCLECSRLAILLRIVKK